MRDARVMGDDLKQFNCLENAIMIGAYLLIYGRPPPRPLLHWNPISEKGVALSFGGREILNA